MLALKANRPKPDRHNHFDMEKDKPKNINTELIYYMFDEIKAELRDIKKEYVTKAESAALKHQIEELRDDLAEYKANTAKEMVAIKNQKNLWAWLSPTLTAVFTAVFTYLVVAYINR